MPAGSEPGPVPLPHTWRPLGVRMAGAVLGGGLLVVCALAWVGFDAETRARFTAFQRGTLLVARAARVRRSGSRWCARGSSPRPERLVVVNGYRRREYEWAEVVAVHLPPGAPWVTLDLADGTTRRRRWASRAPTATAPRRRGPRSCGAVVAATSRASPERSDPPRTRAELVAVRRPAGASVDQVRRRSGRRRPARSSARPPATAAPVPGHVVGAEDLQPAVPLVDPQRHAAPARRVGAATTVATPSASRSRSVKASLKPTSRIGRAIRKSYAVPSTSSRPTGSSRSSTSEPGGRRERSAPSRRPARCRP